MAMDDPAARLRAWLPHILLLALVATSVGLLVAVVRPLADALVMAGSVALLTYPIVCAPLLLRLGRWAPHWSPEQRRLTAAAAATIIVAAIAVLLVVGALVLILGRVDEVWNLLTGLLLGDGRRIDRAIDTVVRKLDHILHFYPQLPFDRDMVRDAIRQFLGRGQVGADVLSWLFRGTVGVLGSGALTLVALFYLYAQGSHLASMLMRWLPLTPIRREQLSARFGHLATYVAAGVVARALVHGLVCGMIAWAIAGADPIASGAVAAFLALLPVVGPAIAWAPYASLLWSGHRYVEAALLAVACVSAAWVVELLFQRLARRLGADRLWFGFLLFCGIVGGVASYGLRGVIIGPAAALTAAALFGFLPAVYGVGRIEASAGGTPEAGSATPSDGAPGDGDAPG